MPRESITLEPEVLALVHEHPEELGLDAKLSVAKRNRAIYEAGLNYLRAQHRRSDRAEYYAALASDPESRAVAAASHAMALEDGLV